MSMAPRDAAFSSQRPAADEGLGRAPRRHDPLPAGRLRRASPARAGPPSGPISSSRRCRPTRSTSSGSTRTAGPSGRSRSSGSRPPALTPRSVRRARPGDDHRRQLRRAWDIIADQPRRASSCDSRRPSRPAWRDDLAPDAGRRDRARRVAHVARDGRRNHRDPALDPVLGGRCGGPRTARSTGRRGRDTRKGREPLPFLDESPRWPAGHPGLDRRDPFRRGGNLHQRPRT